ncbi:MAG: NADPH:quinone oxidoreductase family protein [Oceanicoccus sp.]
MKALICSELSADLSKLHFENIELPDPQPGMVKVRMRAAAACFQDYLMAQGLYQLKPPLPFTPGVEGAGEVIAVGEGVNSVKIGDAVVAGMGFGAYAEEAIVAARNVRIKPDCLSFNEGAAYMSAYITAYVALYRRAQLQPGETLLVHGAAGGIGLAACDLGKMFGATVIATASSEEKREVLKARGVDHVLDVGEGFRDEVKTLTNGHGADVIYDPVGGDVFNESCRCIAFDGRLLVMGFTSGEHVKIATNYALIKGFSVMGVRAGEYGRRFPGRGLENIAWVDRMASTGKIKPYIGATFSLDQVHEAINMVCQRKAIGKVIVTIP